MKLRNDKELFKILKMTQKQLKLYLKKRLKLNGYQIIDKPGFLFCVRPKNNIPILLVSHLDTVLKQPPNKIFISEDNNLLIGQNGLGRDDRAGIMAILSIIDNIQEKPFILFCEDEEIGGIGAKSFTENKIYTLYNFKYIIELDRRGEEDCVFYSCGNPDFTQYITSFGWKENIGSFSDISILMPEMEIAGVNLSIGYYYEHTEKEYLDLTAWENSIKRVILMLKDHKNAANFSYIRNNVIYNGFFSYSFPEEYDYNQYDLFYVLLDNEEYIYIDGTIYSSTDYDLYLGEDDCVYVKNGEFFEIVSYSAFDKNGEIRHFTLEDEYKALNSYEIFS